MIDLFSLGLTHALMMVVVWRLLTRADLEDDSVPPPMGPTVEAEGRAAATRVGGEQGWYRRA